MKKRFRIRNNRRHRRCVAWVCIGVLAFVWAERSVTRILFSYGEHAAAAKAQALFAEVVGELCESDAFSDTVFLETDENDKVTAFSGNTALQNAIQASLATKLCEAFDQADRASFSVPLGTLFGDSFSSGRGPSVTFYIALAESPTVTLSDSFSSAGINQTYFTVTADAEIAVLVTALGKTKRMTVSLSVPVSQLAIVGDVPRFYASKKE